MRFLLGATLAIVLTASHSFAEQEDAVQRALDAITATADKICNAVPIETSAEGVELTGSARAEVTGIIKEVADLGIEGAAKYYNNSAQRAVLESDLADALNDNANCKLSVFNTLQQKMIPDIAPPSPPPEQTCTIELVIPASNAVLPQSLLSGGKFETRWQFGWRACPEASRYHLYVIGPNALNPLVNDDSIVSATYEYKDSSYGISNLIGWKWKVRAFVDGSWGPWSEERTFDVASKPESGAEPEPEPTATCSSEIFVPARGIRTLPGDARIVRGDSEMDSDDWTSVELSYEIKITSPTISLAVSWTAQERNGDKSVGNTRIQSKKTVPLFDLRKQSGCQGYRILGVDVDRSARRELYYRGESHGRRAFPDTGALTDIGVEFDRKGAHDEQVHKLNATLVGFNVRTRKK